MPRFKMGLDFLFIYFCNQLFSGHEGGKKNIKKTDTFTHIN